MTTQSKFSPSIGQASTESAIFESAEVTTSKQSTLSVEDSPARTFPTPDSGQVLTESEADYSLRPFAWFANYNREQLCCRTWQRCLLGDWTEFSGRWPRSGLMRSGIAYRLPPLVPRISGTGCSFWPTPRALEIRNGDSHLRERTKPGRAGPSGLTSMVQYVESGRYPTPTARDYRSGKGKTQAERGRTAGPSLAEMSGGLLNPQWVEWLMGFPLGWTDLGDSETQ
jgi:hypothetical protein